MVFQAGDKIDQFQIQQHIAQGSAADVYIAIDQTTGQQVAIKVSNQLTTGAPAQVERFRRELEVMKLLDHPSIQKGIASGEFNRTPYLVTEWVNGKSMRDVVNEEAPMSPAKAISLIRRLAEGMAYCHAHGVIHRDMKPENVVIRDDGQPIILDFGLALTKDAKRVTYANLVPTTGTPDYMSPERCEGQRGNVKSDIYALGVMLYELVAGHPPFTGDTNMVVMARQMHGTIPRLDKAVTGVSPQLAAIVAKTLQKNPDDRYPDMATFIEALDHPEQTDLKILAALGTAFRRTFWNAQRFITIAFSMALLMSVIVAVLATQML